MDQEYEVNQKLADLIYDSGLQVKENKKSYIFDCPRCKKQKKLFLYKTSGRFVCWYCADTSGFKGRAEFALAELTGRSVAAIQKEIYGSELKTADVFFDFELVNRWADDDEEEDDTPDMSKLDHVLWSPDYYPIDHPFSVKGADYLAGRGIDLPTALHYGLRYGPIDRRVAFPVALQGSLFGWQARFIGDTEWIDPETGQTRHIPKILSTESLSGKRDKLVQFADQLIGSDQAILCEGPVDAIKCHLCQPRPDMPAGNIDTMGKVVSEQQIALLKYSGIKRVYIAQDPDAVDEITRLVKAFEPEVAVYLMEVPKPFKDFGEMSPEGVRRCYKAARRAIPGQMYVYLSPDALLRGRRA